jgi:hypothetical protein
MKADSARICRNDHLNRWKLSALHPLDGFILSVKRPSSLTFTRLRDELGHVTSKSRIRTRRVTKQRRRFKVCQAPNHLFMELGWCWTSQRPASGCRKVHEEAARVQFGEHLEAGAVCLATLSSVQNLCPERSRRLRRCSRGEPPSNTLIF